MSSGSKRLSGERGARRDALRGLRNAARAAPQPFENSRETLVLLRISSRCGRNIEAMPFTTTIPIWLVALVFAAVAPWCVRAFADAIEERLRRRTAAVLARAGAPRVDAVDAAIENTDVEQERVRES